MNIGQMLTNAARRRPDSPAVTWGARTLTYAELDARTNSLAHALADLGVQRGDRVAVLMRNRPELLEAMFACFKAGWPSCGGYLVSPRKPAWRAASMACGGLSKSGSPMVSAMTSIPCARIARAFAVMATVAATGARPSRCANSGMG